MGPGRCRPDWPQDHHRHIWRLGRTWWWCLLGEGPHQSGQVRCLHLPADGKICSQKRPLQTSARAAFLCHWRGKTPLTLRETYGTEQGALTAEDITNVIKIAFDCRPGAIAMS